MRRTFAFTIEHGPHGAGFVGSGLARYRLWTMVQRVLRRKVAPWHDATLVSISRDDKGCAYAAPGTFTIQTRDGETFRVSVVRTEG